MEGGGQRKRKAGPIALDWDKLHNDDEPPPPIEVIEEKAEKSKPLVEVTMEGGGEESKEYLKRMSDKDLTEKITRLNNLGRLSSMLPDGGERLQVSLKRHEAELERRKLLKDDDKCKKGTPLADESTCTGATDDLSPCGVPPSSSAQSTFALHFCSKLDDKGPTKSFTEELSTLNCSGCKTRRENGSFLMQKTQMGLSSRQAPFKSPSHLSVK